MKLSQKLRQLQREADNGELTQDAIEDGFNRCIEDAEYLEQKEETHNSLVKAIEKEQFNEDGTENKYGDLCTIGEAVLNELDMWM